MNKKLLISGASTFACAIFFIFWCIWNGHLPYPPGVGSIEERGQFGDSFGFLSALFTAIGFLGLLVTIFLQQSQISHQAKELQRQARIDTENRERDEVTQFEQLLFRLLDYYVESVESIQFIRKNIEYTGRSALSYCLQQMQHELKKRNLNYFPSADLKKHGVNPGSDAHNLLLEYMTIENTRVVNYTLSYQKRVIATLISLLRHLENRCPIHAKIDTYREVISARITHLEVQYIFGIALIYANEAELRELLEKSQLLNRDSAPYNTKFHQEMYFRLWNITVGDPSKARKLAFAPKANEEIRKASTSEPLAGLLIKFKISSPIQTESMHQISPVEVKQTQ